MTFSRFFAHSKSSRRRGALPLPRRMQSQNRTTKRQQRNTSVGVDAALSPAARNRKIARIFGKTAQRFVGADASVRPWGNGKFAAAYRKNGRASCGSMWASTPTNVVRIRIGAFVFVGARRRADRVVRPYGCVPVGFDTVEFLALYCAGGVLPRPYGIFGGWMQTLIPAAGTSFLHFPTSPLRPAPR